MRDENSTLEIEGGPSRNYTDDALLIKFWLKMLDRLDPNSELAARMRDSLTATAPQWHFALVRDTERNDAYEAAIRRAVRPGSFVFEIGAGTGILAMMAARAGARRVVTCEVNPAIAAAARENVARNGFADRIEVVAAHSTLLDAERDFGERADVLVSEIIGDRMVEESVLESHAHALRDLLKPDAAIIPGAGAIRVALAEDRRSDRYRLQAVSGFDLSAFNRLAQTGGRVARADQITLRSEATTLVGYDFTSRTIAPVRSSIRCRSAGGRVDGVVQWISLDLDSDARLENQPRAGAFSAWTPRFYPFATPIDTRPGDAFTVHAAGRGRNITIWADPSPDRG